MQNQNRNRLELGIVGLGRIGGNLARQALSKGIRVVALVRHEVPADLLELGIEAVKDPQEFGNRLKQPRSVFAYVPAGSTVDEVFQRLIPGLSLGDILVDGGNSYWKDSILRSEYYTQLGFHFVDCGTSGGWSGALHGACFMVGGPKEAFEKLEPIFRQLAVPGGYFYTGPSGSGHFTKLVHNGIEFGMLQAIGEGIQLLESHSPSLDVGGILKLWQNGSVIRSWLIDLMESGYQKNAGVNSIPDYIDDTGEVNWLIGDAIARDVPIPVISQSVIQLIQSRDSKRTWAKAIAVMRNGFGAHQLGVSPSAEKERLEGRLTDQERTNLIHAKKTRDAA
jgi:6-phosphogluconate dehydrogenase